jgi:hypothetical protein
MEGGEKMKKRERKEGRNERRKVRNEIVNLV